MIDFYKKYPILCSKAFDISCPEGWEPIVDKCLTRLEDIRKVWDESEACKQRERSNDGNVHVLRVAQIKEKFGSGRIHVDGGEFDFVQKITSFFETMCGYICESCGTTKDVSTKGGYIQTLCSSCRENRKSKWSSQ